MKLNALKIAMITAMLPLAAHAGVTIAPMATYQSLDDFADNEVIPQIGLGYKFQELPFAIEAVYGAGEFDLTDKAGVYGNAAGTGTTDMQQYRVDLKMFLPSFSPKLEPYIAAGGGQIFLDGAAPGSALAVSGDDGTNSYGTYNGGLGMQYSFTPKVQGIADARYYGFEIDEAGSNNNIDDYQLSLGLQIDLGGEAAVAPVAPMPEPVKQMPKDSDNDGVIDANDKCPATPTTFAVDADGCPIEIVKPVSVPVRILFEFDKSNIQPQYQDEVKKVADFMDQFPTSTVVVEGHTDSKGSDEYNMALSERRAASVAGSLESNYNINSQRLSTVGYGETQPVATNETEAGRQLNRRVVAVVSGQETTMQPR